MTTRAPTSHNTLGKYRLVAALGQGGMGTVYLAVASGPGEFRKLLVIKELRADLASRPAFIRMFLDEAKLAARLAHRNVVQTIEAGQQVDPEGTRYFLAMEYLDGQPLSALLRRLFDGQGLPLSRHLWILAEALSGLHHAHELRDYDGNSLQVVHRDVSPQNVFVTYQGEVKVVDFGVAKAANASAMTSPGVFKGKFAYAAPEQAQGRPVDRRTDVFAVGVMLWEAIARRRFAEGNPTPAAFDARSNGSEPRIRSVAPDVDPRLAAICDRAMALEPAARFATAEEMRRALLRFLQETGERVGPDEVGDLLCSVFAEERLEVQRVLDAALGKGDNVVSMVRPLPVLESEPSGDDERPTTVADLSELVETSREDTGAPQLATALEPDQHGFEPTPVVDMDAISAAAALPRSGRGWKIALAGMALSIGVVLGYRALQPEASDTAGREPAAAPPVERVPDRANLPHEASSEPESPDTVEPTTPEPRRERSARPPAPVRPQPVARSAPAPAPAPARQREPADATRREQAHDARAEPVRRGPQMGDDLERMRRPPLAIDTEDPYDD